MVDISYFCCAIALQRKEADDGDDAVPEEIANNLDSITAESLRVSLHSIVIHFPLAVLMNHLR